MVTGDVTPGDAKRKKGTQTKLSRNSRSVTRFSVKVINRGLCRRESIVRSSIEKTVDIACIQYDACTVLEDDSTGGRQYGLQTTERRLIFFVDRLDLMHR